MKLYTAHFVAESTGYSVYFPGLSGCVTEGDTLEDAYANAQDALGLYLADYAENNKPFPPQDMGKADACKDGDVMSLISCDVDKYRITKSVKKTLTIPSWLNKAAEENNMNFSRILQDALKERLKL